MLRSSLLVAATVAGGARPQRLRRRRWPDRAGGVPRHDRHARRQGHDQEEADAASSRSRRPRPRRCSRSAPASRSSPSTTSPTTRRARPKTTLSGFTPNVEAIAAHRPDLVVIAYDSKGLSGALRSLGITVVHHDGAKHVQGRVPADPPARPRHRNTRRRRRASSRGMKAKIARIVEASQARASALSVYHELTPGLLLGHVEHVRRQGLRGARASQHRGRGRLGRHGLPAALGRVHRLVEPGPDRARGQRLLRPEALDGRGAAGLGSRSAPCGRARSCASTTRSRRAGGRGSWTSSGRCRPRSPACRTVGATAAHDSVAGRRSELGA